jgi:hypothetical protein
LDAAAAFQAMLRDSTLAVITERSCPKAEGIAQEIVREIEMWLYFMEMMTSMEQCRYVLFVPSRNTQSS